MDIEILEMADRKCKFILKNSTPAMANALRRTMLSDIPKMAIDNVEFHLGPIDVDGKEFESITPLFNEIIAHRLGMVPVPTDLDTYTFKDKCVCGGEGCPSCTMMYSLNKNGPCTVLSGDLMPLGDPEMMKVKDEFIPIVELTDEQSVMIYAHAVMGTARQHVKWQAAFGVGYKYMPTVKIDGNEVGFDEPVKVCKHHVYAMDGRKLDIVEDPKDCICCRQEEDGERSGIEIGSDDTVFVFKFETDGSLTAQQVLDKAVELLSADAKAFAEKVAAL